jgi:flagellar basal body-associated protein FliL
MTTTQKMLLRKAQINQKSKKSMTFVIISTIIVFALACIMAYNTFGLQTLL